MDCLLRLLGVVESNICNATTDIPIVFNVYKLAVEHNRLSDLSNFAIASLTKGVLSEEFCLGRKSLMAWSNENLFSFIYMLDAMRWNRIWLYGFCVGSQVCSRAVGGLVYLVCLHVIFWKGLPECDVA